jgi:hypothetical protein
MKTLWNIREIVLFRLLEKTTFSAGTAELTGTCKVNTDKQGLDSAHIKSNLRRLSRVGVFSESIHKFPVNLKRGRRAFLFAIWV